MEASKEYPQWERRKKLIRAVHDWYETQTDIRAQLWYNDLVALVADPLDEGVNTPTGAEYDRSAIDSAQYRVMNLFVALVKDGYIDADINTAIVDLPFTSARVQGLTGKGLQAIGEMPDPNEEIQKTELEKQRQVQEVREEMLAESPTVREFTNLQYDVFVSHASEDKEAFVKPLADLLSNMNFQVWYDAFTLKVGDSLRRSIDKGIADSKYGIVVLSPAFFAKEWPQRELDGLTAREVAGQKRSFYPSGMISGAKRYYSAAPRWQTRSPSLLETRASKRSPRILQSSCVINEVG